MKQEVERIKAEYEIYLSLCEAASLTPVPLGGQFEILQAMWALGPEVIPYVASTGTVWVHNIRHKTNRRDRPFEVANMEALRARD